MENKYDHINFDYDKIAEDYESKMKKEKGLFDHGGGNDVKGGIVINQLKRYAKRIADATGRSANATIEVWYHPESANDNGGYNVEFKSFDYAHRQHIRPQYKTDDLRALGIAIEGYLRNLNR